MKKILYIIPGFGEQTSDPAYKKITKEARKAGYDIVTHNPKWDRRTATDWLADFSAVVEKKGSKDASVVGFSFGAYIAVISAMKFSFDKLFLCSLSPYFKDDLPHIPASVWKILGIRRKKDFGKYNFPEDIKSKAVFLVGQKEIAYELSAVKSRFDAWGGKKKLTIVPDSEHSLDSGEYLPLLLDEIKNPD